MDWSICSIFLVALAFEILYVGFKAGNTVRARTAPQGKKNQGAQVTRSIHTTQPQKAANAAFFCFLAQA